MLERKTVCQNCGEDYPPGWPHTCPEESSRSPGCSTANLHDWLDEYFDQRPQLKRPPKTALGYEMPPEWKPVIEKLFYGR